MDTLQNGVTENKAHVALIDITGVKIIDTQVAGVRLRAAQAVRLLGAQVVLTGISRPGDVAPQYGASDGTGCL
jgi:rsbT co-antagonist protein RsbR